MTTVNVSVVDMVLGSYHGLKMEGHLAISSDCSFQDLRYLNEGSVGMTLNGNVISHWEFPNFSVLEVPEATLEELYIQNGDEVAVLGSAPRIEIGYIANKTDGDAYMMFSCWAGEWYSFVHYKRVITYLGTGYRCGHVEVIGDKAFSTHSYGDIRVNDALITITRKGLWSQYDPRGHKEGLICELYGVEHRIKVQRTHDLIVTGLPENGVIVETSDGKRRYKYRLPDFPLNLGDIVECANTFVKRIRIDKKVAEPCDAYDRIENSLTYTTFGARLMSVLKKMKTMERRQIFVVPKIIMDEYLYTNITARGRINALCDMFPQYDPRDIARTVRAMGGVMEALNYVMPRRMSYDTFVALYSNIGQIQPKIDTTEFGKVGFDFKNLLEIEQSVILVDEGMVQGAATNLEFSLGRNLSYDEMFEAAIRVLDEIPIEKARHTKICNAEFLRVSHIRCPGCIYANAAKFVVEYVASLGNCGDVSLTNAHLGLYRRNVRRRQKWGDVVNTKSVLKDSEMHRKWSGYDERICYYCGVRVNKFSVRDKELYQRTNVDFCIDCWYNFEQDHKEKV